MPADPRADPWSGITYHGFSGPSPAPSRARSRAPHERPAPASRRPSTRSLLLGGVGVALLLGLIFGALAKPDLKTDPGRTTNAAASAPGAAAAALAQPGAGLGATPQMTIEVNQPPPGEAPRAAGKLEVLPPDLARRAQQPAPLMSPATPGAPAFEPAPLPAVADVAPPPAVQPAPLAVPAPRYRASFDCGAARPGAEQMVCSDPDLAAADRQLAQAYRRALQSGAPAGPLRADQQDWLDIREDAARHGPGAVASIYNQRIDELNEAAQDGY
jgi:uncharacterized protein YecT (DUF1311 family)